MKYKVRLLESTLNIPSKLKAVTTNLNDIENWKTTIWLYNNAPQGTPKEKGALGEVGYVAFSTDSNTIVPIAQMDEHQEGKEVIYWLIKNNIIPDENYFPLWLKDNPYFYSNRLEDKEFRNYKKNLTSALKSYIANGGNPDTLMYDYYDYRARASITIADFLKGKKAVRTVDPDAPISKSGRFILADIEEYIKLYLKSLKNMDVGEELMTSCENILYSVIYFMEVNGIQNEDVVYRTIQQLKEVFLRKRSEDKSYYIILGTGGVKNLLHTKLKQELKNKDSRYAILFGNIEKAIQEFNRLAEI